VEDQTPAVRGVEHAATGGVTVPGVQGRTTAQGRRERAMDVAPGFEGGRRVEIADVLQSGGPGGRDVVADAGPPGGPCRVVGREQQVMGHVEVMEPVRVAGDEPERRYA
jgi:hypothetical protein